MSILAIPQDITVLIFTYCDADSLRRLAQICQSFRILLMRNLTWKQLWDAKFALGPDVDLVRSMIVIYAKAGDWRHVPFWKAAFLYYSTVVRWAEAAADRVRKGNKKASTRWCWSLTFTEEEMADPDFEGEGWFLSSKPKEPRVLPWPQILDDGHETVMLSDESDARTKEVTLLLLAKIVKYFPCLRGYRDAVSYFMVYWQGAGNFEGYQLLHFESYNMSTMLRLDFHLHGRDTILVYLYRDGYAGHYLGEFVPLFRVRAKLCNVHQYLASILEVFQKESLLAQPKPAERRGVFDESFIPVVLKRLRQDLVAAAEMEADRQAHVLLSQLGAEPAGTDRRLVACLAHLPGLPVANEKRKAYCNLAAVRRAVQRVINGLLLPYLEKTLAHCKLEGTKDRQRQAYKERKGVHKANVHRALKKEWPETALLQSLYLTVPVCALLGLYVQSQQGAQFAGGADTVRMIEEKLECAWLTPMEIRQVVGQFVGQP